MSWFEETAEDRREIARERLMLDATERVAEAMADRGVTQADLAARLGVSPAEISMRLRGTRNLTLKTLADMLDAIGCDVHVEVADRRSYRRWSGATAYTGPTIRYTSRGTQLRALPSAS